MIVKDFEVNLKLMTNFDCSIFFINKKIMIEIIRNIVMLCYIYMLSFKPQCFMIDIRQSNMWV